MTDIPAPRPASTLVLVRDAQHAPEIFMVRRSAQASFFGGAYVFPGGRLDDSDRSEAILARVRGLTQEAAARLQEPIEQAKALYIAALRETFEEAGVLLATEEDGALAQLQTPERESLVKETRRRLIAGEASAFLSLLEQANLYLDVSQVAFFARWVTPEAEPKRFDARFFVAVAPSDQEAAHDQAETTEGVWLSAAQIIEQHKQGQIFLAPPTFRTLENLLPFQTTKEIISDAFVAEPPIVKPYLRFGEDSEVQLLLDHDPEHPNPGPAPYVKGDSRIVLKEGRWWSKTPSSER